MTLFKKKIYLLIVFFNSVQIIFEVAKIIISFIDKQLSFASGFSFIGKIPTVLLFLFGGLIDMTSLFLLINVLPALLALKYKGAKFEITMAGTLVGCVMAGSFIMGTIIQTSVTPFYMENGEPLAGSKRIVFCVLLVCANIPYLEWAHLEWQEIWKMRAQQVKKDKRRGKRDQCTRFMAKYICCCACCHSCLGIENQEEDSRETLVFLPQDDNPYNPSMIGTLDRGSILAHQYRFSLANRSITPV